MPLVQDESSLIKDDEDDTWFCAILLESATARVAHFSKEKPPVPS